jgi:L-fucose isomerase-like protein
MKIHIKLLAFRNAPETIFDQAVSRIEKLIPAGTYQITDSDPDVLFFLSGGSEQVALEHVAAGHFCLLVGSQHGNAYASATEVKAYLNSLKIPSLLLDEEEAGTAAILRDLCIVKQALHNLSGKRLGLIGKVSEWLIASAISAELLEAKFGIRLVVIPWDDLPHYSGCRPSDAFQKHFPAVNHPGITDTAKVSTLLEEAIRKWNLDALTVECFPMVQKDGVTACLPLAKFNDDGIPAGCEGDLTAIAGMMLCHELTGVIPWMANINKAVDDHCLFSHCTIAPGLVAAFSVTTHYETGKGTAIEGNFKGDLVTVFRFDHALGRAFIATGTITERPRSASACRTQVAVRLTEKEVSLLREDPLGNHHLIVPGDCKKLLQLACKVLGIDVLK